MRIRTLTQIASTRTHGAERGARKRCTPSSAKQQQAAASSSSKQQQQQDMSLLSRTVALVTGGSSGLGAGAAWRLVQHGAKVVVADLAATESTFDAWKLQATTTTTTTAKNDNDNDDSSHLTFVATDVTDADAVARALDAVERVYGESVNAVVNCAGMALARKTLSQQGAMVHSVEDFTKTLTVNTVGTFIVSSLAAQRMSQRRPLLVPETLLTSSETTVSSSSQHPHPHAQLRGCIIHTASIAAYEGQVGQVAYAASKGAIVGMTLPMARDLAPFGIRVMTIVRFCVCVCVFSIACFPRHATFFSKASKLFFFHGVETISRLPDCLPLHSWTDCPTRSSPNWVRRYRAPVGLERPTNLVNWW
jgi:3-hydroxyacyl-CoA dehydrogenase / 3-hydroxy-2-methylbutyryl-CoA dehydrogenase